MKEFKINEYITLKLEDNKTIIYVKDEEFMQCKALLLEIPTDKIKSLKNIESIDEVADRLDKALEFSDGGINDKIPPETEFWGHCSNLQTWFENNYDTRLLHKNLAFYLLKKLSEIGDPLAKKVFKDEIVKRISSGYIPVIKFLVETRHLDFFTNEEIKTLFQGYEFIKYNGKIIPMVQDTLDLSFLEIKDLSDVIGLNKLISLKSLDLGINNLVSLPESISNFKALQYLCLESNNLTSLPESIINLKTLQYLRLTGNNLSSLPESIINLKTLKLLSIGNINLNVLPESISNLSSLQVIDLHSNNLTSLPESIGNLKSLKSIYLYNNNLISLPESIGNLKSLQKLYLRDNQLISLPKSIGTLTSLNFLDLKGNNLTTLPETIIGLTSLKELLLEDNPIVRNINPKTIKIIKNLQKAGVKVILKELDHG